LKRDLHCGRHIDVIIEIDFGKKLVVTYPFHSTFPLHFFEKTQALDNGR